MANLKSKFMEIIKKNEGLTANKIATTAGFAKATPKHKDVIEELVKEGSIREDKSGRFPVYYVADADAVIESNDSAEPAEMPAWVENNSVAKALYESIGKFPGCTGNKIAVNAGYSKASPNHKELLAKLVAKGVAYIDKSGKRPVYYLAGVAAEAGSKSGKSETKVGYAPARKIPVKTDGFEFKRVGSDVEIVTPDKKKYKIKDTQRFVIINNDLKGQFVVNNAAEAIGVIDYYAQEKGIRNYNIKDLATQKNMSGGEDDFKGYDSIVITLRLSAHNKGGSL